MRRAHAVPNHRGAERHELLGDLQHSGASVGGQELRQPAVVGNAVDEKHPMPGMGENAGLVVH